MASASPSGPSREPDLRPSSERLRELDIDRAGTFEEANDRLYRAGLTDGLPVVPPTSERIAAAMKPCRNGPDHQLDVLTLSFVAPTLWDVAANAVMAGCEPAYLPVIAAALRALADPDFNLLGIQSTTGSATPIIIVNGPVARELDINGGPNCIGQGWRANATIGRAIRLVLQNVGMAIPGTTDMATQGQPGKFSWCLAENEAASPWPPFHSERGFPANASAVTVVGATGNVEVVMGGTTPEVLVTTLAGSMTLAGNLGAAGTFGSGQALVLLPPECADTFTSHGWDRGRVQRALFEQARVPYARLGEAAAERVRRVREGREMEPADAVPVTRSPEDILIVVAGGVGFKATFVPTWGGGTEAVTRLVEPL